MKEFDPFVSKYLLDQGLQKVADRVSGFLAGIWTLFYLRNKVSYFWTLCPEVR